MEKSLSFITSCGMLKGIKNWLISFVHLQLVITLFGLPIFVLWGLPVSCATLLGNFIFSPLLVLFIGLCCMITLCELIYIPHALFDYALEQTSMIWYKLLSWSSPAWLIGCSLRTLPIVLLCCIIFYLFHAQTNPSKEKQILLSACFLFIIFSSNYVLKKNVYFIVDQTHILHFQNHTVCIDNGTLSKKRSAQSWIDYTLLPELIRYTGSPHIDTFISFNTNKRIYRAAKKLELQASIKNIFFRNRLYREKSINKYSASDKTFRSVKLFNKRLISVR